MNPLETIKEWIPTGTEAQIGAMMSSIGTTMTYLLGWNQAVEALLVLMIIDYLTGVLAAYIDPRTKLDSRLGFKGICKKIVILMLVVLATELGRAAGIAGLQTVVVWFFVGNEGLSIIENAAKAGVPVPKRLRDTLEQLTKEQDARKGPGK